MDETEEGLMRRPVSEEVFVEESPREVPVTEEKQRADYIPIRRLENRTLAAYDEKILPKRPIILNDDVTDERMIRASLKYATKHPEDYEVHFPRAKQDKTIEEARPSVLEETIETAHKREEISVSSSGGVDDVTESQDRDGEGLYCASFKCSGAVNRRELPPNAKFCGICRSEGLGRFDEDICDLLEDGKNYTTDEGKRVDENPLEVIASDVISKLGSAGRIAFKALAYPTLGNLSGKLQTRLENLVGKENYDAGRAKVISSFTNTALYGIGLGYLGYKSLMPGVDYSSLEASEVDLFGAAATIGVIWGFSEAGIRNILAGAGPRASAVGKILSLPLEATLRAYDKTKNYMKSVKERTK